MTTKQNGFRRIKCIFYFMFSFLVLSAQNQMNSVFDAHRGGDITWFAYQNRSSMLYMDMYNEAVKMLEERKERIKPLNTPDDWVIYRSELKDRVFKGLSGFDKTPLNAKITGTVKRETFNVEKILFESHPQFYVTACLFIPNKRQKPAPVIIYCSGHGECLTWFRKDLLFLQ
jgi:hypothetical protein